MNVVLEIVSGVVQAIAGLFANAGVTRRRGDLAEIRTRYPRSAVHRAEFVEGFGPAEAYDRVAFVVGNRLGLAFLDSFGHQEHRVPIEQIDELELLSGPDDDGQHVRVLSPDETVLIEFWSPEEAGDVHAALVDALPGRLTR